MPSSFCVKLDEENQIIRVSITGDIDGAISQAISESIRAAAARLTDPNCVKILFSESQPGRLDRHARKMFVDQLRRSDFAKIAMVGIPGFVRAVINFLSLIAKVSKARAFETEQQALSWLQQGGHHAADGGATDQSSSANSNTRT